MDLDGSQSFSEALKVTAAVAGTGTDVPVTYSLDQNYPNPFNPSTEIRYGLPAGGYVMLEVYSVLGERVATLVSEVQSAGYHVVRFNKPGLASGVYLYRLTAGGFVAARKLLLLK